MLRNRHQQTRTPQQGFSIIEALLALSLFALITTIFVGAWLYGQETVVSSGKYVRALMLAEEGLEAVRSIRDSAREDIVISTRELAISNDTWNLEHNGDDTGEFTRNIQVSRIDNDRKEVVSTVTWQQSPLRTGSISLTTRLTDWQDRQVYLPQPSSGGGSGGGGGGQPGASSCNDVAIANSYTSGTCRQNAQQCTNNSEDTLPAGDQYCTTDPALTICCAAPAGGEEDTTAPSAVSNLASSGVTSSSINITWTAPGDDGSTGTATTYDVRYSTTNITQGNWSSKTQATGEPMPSVAGSSESMTISGLAASTQYYVAIRTSDEVPNQSSLSNVITVTTSSGSQGTTCNSYAVDLEYSAGTCRQNSNKCSQNSEDYLSGGDQFCTGGAAADTCCALP